jgi:hypothetical protein
MSRVFLSSTIEDLQPERRELHDVFHRLCLAAIAQEHFGACPDPTTDTIVKAISDGECLIYVLVIGFRYGSLVPEEKLPARLNYPANTRISYSEMEFDLATYRKMRRLVYLKASSGKFSVDVDEQQAERRANLIKKINDAGCTYFKFRNAADLAKQAAIDVQKQMFECEYRRQLLGNAFDL